jgi:hypothetical protein
MDPFNWTCPFCNQPTTVTEPNHSDDSVDIDRPTKDGPRKIRFVSVARPNPNCRKLVISAGMFEARKDQYNRLSAGELLKRWSLLPSGTAKPFPNYIPTQILADYNEACVIRDLSPKTSATLCRRCLQGMIRDFLGDHEVTIKG